MGLVFRVGSLMLLLSEEAISFLLCQSRHSLLFGGAECGRAETCKRRQPWVRSSLKLFRLSMQCRSSASLRLGKFGTGE